jgi:hypothetical protein
VTSDRPNIEQASSTGKKYAMTLFAWFSENCLEKWTFRSPGIARDFCKMHIAFANCIEIV